MRPFSKLSDYLDDDSKFIREQFKKTGRVHNNYLGWIHEVLEKDGERDLADFFSYDRTEGYEGGCEAVDRLGLNSDHAKLLKDMLKFLENNQAEHRKVTPASACPSPIPGPGSSRFSLRPCGGMGIVSAGLVSERFELRKENNEEGCVWIVCPGDGF